MVVFEGRNTISMIHLREKAFWKQKKEHEIERGFASDVFQCLSIQINVMLKCHTLGYHFLSSNICLHGTSLLKKS